jgi:hypothetical protein
VRNRAIRTGIKDAKPFQFVTFLDHPQQALRQILDVNIGDGG